MLEVEGLAEALWLLIEESDEVEPVLPLPGNVLLLGMLLLPPELVVPYGELLLWPAVLPDEDP